MRDLRIALLNATHGDENATRNFRRELDGSLAEFDVTNGQLPECFAYDAVVVTGSRASVYWDEPWIPPTKAWVADAIDRGIPCLGICWGHQLLADVLGGEVRGMGAYEIGYREIERTAEESLLLSGVDPTFTAFTTHRDAVAELPPGAEELARNDYSNHGFRLDRVFGVQFHPEYDAKSARDLTMEKELTDERRERVLAAITAENVELAHEAKRVFDNFLGFVEDVRAAPVSATGASEDGVDADGCVDDTGAADDDTTKTDEDAALAADTGTASPTTASTAPAPEDVTGTVADDGAADDGEYTTPAADGCSSDD